MANAFESWHPSPALRPELGLSQSRYDHETDGKCGLTSSLTQLQQMKDIQDRARHALPQRRRDQRLPTRRWSDIPPTQRSSSGGYSLNSEDERTGMASLQTIFETTDGRIEIIRHDAAPSAPHGRGGDLRTRKYCDVIDKPDEATQTTSTPLYAQARIRTFSPTRRRLAPSCAGCVR